MRTLVLSLVAAFALTGLGVAHASAPPVIVAEASAAPSPAAVPAAVVHVKDFAFAPSTLTIKAGDTVRFVQDDEAPHTVTAADQSFDSGNLDRHATWSHTFDVAGTYAYICSYHTFMKGTIVVK